MARIKKKDSRELKQEQFTPDERTELSERDPLLVIHDSMQDRGFASLWTVGPVAHNVKFDDGAKKYYLQKLAVTGRHNYSAICAGVTRTCVNAHVRSDPIFAVAVEEAKEYFRDLLTAEIHRRGVTGFHEEVVAGKNRDKVIRVLKYSDRMMELLAKIHMKELRPTTKTANIVDNSTVNTLVAPQFNIEDMPPEELAIFKQLVTMQAIRHQDAEKAREEKLINPVAKDA